ncbi:Intraflagellar transport protein 140-like [Hondaea fermentalgiana]|uniref:Intraflagellar transport protein 140-like n=1 Tax=Hondaea fermentalgiana TaxID=2315210 RepID=A0A2R5GPP7_9STRA|nr:Intraflagellar transport protein 140-like [Hondaea fermentalgiana]|eukprot:GBG32279.1 Intraflagellar transport protein 140-like [Hondaea fermentalgiana]
MSLFIDFPVAAPAVVHEDEATEGKEDGQGKTFDAITTAWCKSESILAIAGRGRGVWFANDEGELVQGADLVRSSRNSDACVLDWRVRSKVLATGWDDGAITLWNVKDRILKEDTSVHATAVTVTSWSPEGSRLLTADKHGLMALWRTDHRGRLAVVCKKDLGSGEDITCCCWMLTPEYREAQRELATPPQQVFLGTKFGNVYLVNLKGELLCAARLDAGLRSMNWFEEEQKLVVVTEDASLIQLKPENACTELQVASKSKLSLSASAAISGITEAQWTCPGLLATCATEPHIRLWDLANDSSYSLPLPVVAGDTDAPGSPRPEDLATHISFNAKTRILAASTRQGRLALWRFVGEAATPIFEHASDENDAADEKENIHSSTTKSSEALATRFHFPETNRSSWEAVATLSAVSAPVLSIGWGLREGCLAVIMKDRVSIMNETVLHRALRCDVAALQLSAQRLLVQRGASHRMETHVGLRIKGLDVNDSHALVWSQRKAEVYAFQDNRMERIASFTTRAEAMALYGETILQTEGSHLSVCNLQGVSRAEVSFSEHEGEPRFMHINGKYLAVATHKGMLKVFDVSRREPRPVGGGAWFVSSARSKGGKPLGKQVPIGEIRSIRCNADGTRVSVLCDIVRGQHLREPDTRIHVWNLNRDEFQAYEFGPTRYPVSHFWDGQEPKLLACEAKRLRKSVNSFEEASDAKVKSSKELKGSRLRIVGDEDEDLGDLRRGNSSTSRSSNAPGGAGGNAGVDDVAAAAAADEEKNRLQKMRTALRARNGSAEIAEVEVVTLFATEERVGVMMQDAFPLEGNLEALLGMRVPRLFFISKPSENGGVPRLKGRTMRDFVGLDQRVDDETKRALIDFSYYLTIGNMDEAYRAVKLIDNVSVWENMAHMCVKTRRLDVAEMCMGNMGHVRGAQALRESKREPEVEARIATVAIQLGLLEDAERLYIECGRYDLLNKMLRHSGQWTKSLEVANSFDRIHLRESHFEYGRHLESMGDFKAAIANYEASGTHRKQVPRMLFEAERLDELESYIQTQCDEELTKWWGHYCESLGEYDRSIRVYQRASDDLSLVRVHCVMENFKAAAEIALNSTNLAASYHLARQCEQRGEINEAIQFYSRAGRYNHAVRLAKERGLNADIVNLALRASKTTMVEAARYLEAKGFNEDAVVLYQKGGNVPRALDLCFRSQLFDQLTSIADSLTLRKPSARPDSGSRSRPGSAMRSQSIDGGQGLHRERPESATSQSREEYEQDTTESSPEILTRCAEFFIEHRKFDKAVHLYITAGDFETAIELCFHQKVHISEDMAESMTLDKLSVAPKSGNKKQTPRELARIKEQNERRQRLLESIAKCCKKQGSYHLATKKYTQAGDRLRAMKCLLRSGNTEKIILYASVSRNREIYILAANYLQNLDWRNDAEIMKAIISYYSKAKAYQQLAGFYEACAQMEVDEYRDYDKSLGALKEAVKALGKERDGELKEEMLASLQQRVSLVERFVHARTLVVSDPDEADRICNALLAHPEVNTAVRAGDIFALLVEFHVGNRDFDDAHRLIENMKARNIAVAPYIEAPLLEQIARAVGVDSLIDDDGPRVGKGSAGLGVDSGDEIDDEIEEDLDWGHK